MHEMKWYEKALIGAVGGLALALLKLIDAKFFLSGVAPIEAYAAYLTYFCYVLLGSVAAVFLADHELPPAKIKRSAFVLGLLAPSVLLAIANQPVKSGDPERRQSAAIPALSWIPMSSAYAQGSQPSGRAASGPTLSDKVEVLSESSLKPSFANAFFAAVGRGELNVPYVYVVGGTSSKAKALDTAFKMQQVLSADTAKNFQPRVVQVEGSSGYYVLVGDLASKQELTRVRTDATSTAIKSFGTTPTVGSISLAERKTLADLLVNAPVLPASALSIPPK